jgi:prepilin-type N-terminal cleavage/methylation domain-containing protein
MRRGFTLIEILLVIAIIVVLAAIIFPVVSRTRDQGHLATGINQMKQLGTAMLAYSADTDNHVSPSTNYGLPEDAPERLWTNLLLQYVKDTRVFVAPGIGGRAAVTWASRGEQSIGLNASTAIDRRGCDDDDAPHYTGCNGWKTAVQLDKQDSLSAVVLFSVTPGGDTAQGYRGYEFNPYNGMPNPERPRFAPPLVSDRDLVRELSFLSPDLLKPVFAPYLRTGQDEGRTPVGLADGSAKAFSAKQIQSGSQRLLWRLR